jgi:hypothetical protein
MSTKEAGNREPGVPVGAGALSTIAGNEAMNIIRKGQIRWLPKGDVAGQKRFIERTLGITA